MCQGGRDPGHDANPVTTSNPLWDVWVNEFRIERLLATGDMAQNADDGTGGANAAPATRASTAELRHDRVQHRCSHVEEGVTVALFQRICCFCSCARR
jgi:hypothetical protein